MSQFDLDVKLDCQTTIRVIGVGGSGCNAVRTMVADGAEGAEFVIMNTDRQALNDSPVDHKVQIGERLTRGLGAGANPDVGRKAALEDVNRITDVVTNVDMVFITAGMGGGTGTGAAPVVASAAKEAGALTVGVVTRPFNFEGRRRSRIAEEGLNNLAPFVDALLVIPNDKLLELDPKMPVSEAFRQADGVLSTSVRGITEIIQISGRINVDFADVRTILTNAGSCVMGVGESRGDKRAVEAMQAAICSPFLEETSLRGATRVLVNFVGGTNLTLSEMNDAMRFLQEEIHDDADVIMGHVELDQPDEAVRVTVIATGFRRESQPAAAAAVAAAQAPRQTLYPTASEAAAGRGRERSSAPPPPRRSEAAGRTSQLNLTDEILEIPAYLRKQA
jgi:cell division protein FtsZ